MTTERDAKNANVKELRVLIDKAWGLHSERLAADDRRGADAARKRARRLEAKMVVALRAAQGGAS